jgi:hypothetical protein
MSEVNSATYGAQQYVPVGTMEGRAWHLPPRDPGTRAYHRPESTGAPSCGAIARRRQTSYMPGRCYRRRS